MKKIDKLFKVSAPPRPPPHKSEKLFLGHLGWTRLEISEMFMYNDYVYWGDSKNLHNIHVYPELLSVAKHNKSWVVNGGSLKLPDGLVAACNLWTHNKMGMTLYRFLHNMGF